jgi:hypothetical protein
MQDTDLLGEVATGIHTIKGGKTWDEASKVARGLKYDIRNEVNVEDVGQNLAKVIDRKVSVYERNNLVTKEEAAILKLFGQVILATESVEKAKSRKENVQEVLLDSISAQQEILSAVWDNLDPQTGEVHENLPYYFLAFSELFEEQYRSGRATSERQQGFATGIKGMITTALLFSAAGYEIKLPPWEHDRDFDVDLYVREPKTKRLFAVDITAKRTGDINFEVLLSGRPLPPEAESAVAGFISVNVPPINTQELSSEALRFYQEYGLGIPADSSKADFKDKLKQVTKYI